MTVVLMVCIPLIKKTVIVTLLIFFLIFWTQIELKTSLETWTKLPQNVL